MSKEEVVAIGPVTTMPAPNGDGVMIRQEYRVRRGEEEWTEYDWWHIKRENEGCWKQKKYVDITDLNWDAKEPPNAEEFDETRNIYEPCWINLDALWAGVKALKEMGE